MRLVKRDLLYSLLLLLVSLLFISDIFFHPGKSETFDATTHATTIAQYVLALQSGDFPVVWLDKFANYGLPIGIVAHQLPSYLGAILTFLTNDPFISLNILALIGIYLSNIFFYRFLRFYFQPDIAFISTLFFNFSSYKITNFYIRGAIPEIFSGIFLPLILIALTLFITRKNISSLILLIFSVLALTLTHPMMVFIYSFIITPYFFFQLFLGEGKKMVVRKRIETIVLVGLAAILGLGMGSYYLIPLFLESKYFYFGLSSNHLAANSFLTLRNYFDYSWLKFEPSEIYTRGNTIVVGIVNTLVVLTGTVYIAYQLLKKRMRKDTLLLGFTLIISYILIFFTLSYSKVIYAISLFNSIQFPWRMLSSFVFLPPIILGILLTKWQNKYLYLFCIGIICLFSFPQLFGKDYKEVTKESYYFSRYNSHSIMMNTIWTGKTEEYPVKQEKPEIIEGKGSILAQKVSNSERNYKINAQTNIRMVDYTFYFPGWKLFVDSHEMPIEFQDPAYRGVITYHLDPGLHNVQLLFTRTKIRLISIILSVVFALFSVAYIVLVKRLKFGSQV